jgi:PAS domain-containing protein
MKKQNNNAVKDKIDLQALKEAEARFRSIILWSPDAIIVTDAKGEIEYMNPAITERREAENGCEKNRNKI